MAKDGSVPIPTMSGPSSAIRARWFSRSSVRVVHRWPSQPTYWRSSSQMGQSGRGPPYWAPQVAQIGRSMITTLARDGRVRQDGASFPAEEGSWTGGA